MKILILEDSDERIKQFSRNLIGIDLRIEKTSDGAIDALKEDQEFDYVFLDHDLGGQVYQESTYGTGYEVALHISKMSVKPKNVIIHSLNHHGAALMLRSLRDAGIKARYIPFLWEKVSTSDL